MADVHTAEVRSKNMSAIRGRKNKSTEIVFLKILKEENITGWRRHYKRVYGNPDFSFLKEKVAIFLDGCFWHRCPICYKAPKTNAEFWDTKILKNHMRDMAVTTRLESRGWTVVRVWEHELKKDREQVISRLLSTGLHKEPENKENN